MPRKTPFERISITLPRDVLAIAVRRADELQRPRSWVIAEAVRQYGAAPSPPSESDAAAEVAAARRRHLLADLRLSPEERLRRAAGLLRLAPRARGARRTQIVGFESYEDFYAWKRARRAEGLPRI